MSLKGEAWSVSSYGCVLWLTSTLKFVPKIITFGIYKRTLGIPWELTHSMLYWKYNRPCICHKHFTLGTGVLLLLLDAQVDPCVFFGVLC